MKRPAPYVCEFFEPDPDAWDDALEAEYVECRTLTEAKRLFRKMGGRVLKRTNVEDVTPDSEPVRGVMWEWEDVEVLS